MSWRVLAVVSILVPLGTLDAQTIRGRVLDETNRLPVASAGVTLHDPAGVILTSAITDSVGRYALTTPGPGRYQLRVEGLGYSDFASPLIDVGDFAEYEVDLEVLPEPFALGGLDVTVENETVDDWFTLRFHGNPKARSGFRVIQGRQLAEARAKSDDNTELFRWLFIPVSHGRGVCLLAGYGCGRLYVDNHWRPNQLIETMDLASITQVVVFHVPAEVWVFTDEFDWERRPQRGGEPPPWYRPCPSCS